jgi:hypothetical protein
LCRRVIALAAAYAIVLASLISSVGAARATAEAINQPDSVICHGSGAERPAPAPDESGKICVDSCCIGCLSIAAEVPPPVVTAAVPHSMSQRLALLTRFVLAAAPILTLTAREVRRRRCEA